MISSTPPPHDGSRTTDDSLAAARQRLERLETFIRSDPHNIALLIDAFEMALRCRDWERAQFHLSHGQSLGTDHWGWQLREGDFWLAQGRYAEARNTLEALADIPSPPPGFGVAVLHNLAFVDFRLRRYAQCAERLAPLLSDEHGTATPISTEGVETVLQTLWLRTLHHDLQLDRALAWARSAEAAGLLRAEAAGVASLIALDASDLAAAQRWATLSIDNATHALPAPEALVTRASLALGARDEKQARFFAEGALQVAPHDGRSLSVLGFTDLLAGKLPSASATFRRALEAMPEHIGTWHGSGWTSLLAQDLPGARQAFEQALSLDRNFAESHGGLAVVLAMQGALEEARSHAELALRLDPTNVSGRYAQALLAGQVKEASDLTRIAKRLLAGIADPAGKDMSDLF